MYETWEEGSHLKKYTYKYNGGTGKYERASGGGTYMYELDRHPHRRHIPGQVSLPLTERQVQADIRSIGR
jgi:hypothetical protein